MEYATQWPGASGERTTRELGIEFRDARETYADTLRWLYTAGTSEGAARRRRRSAGGVGAGG